MIGIKEISLSRALERAACRSLPSPFTEDGETFWLEAIALVRKRDGSQSYCLVEHRSDGLLLYKEDFGTMSPIFGLVSIHPYKVLDMERFAFKGGDSKLVQHLCRNFPYMESEIRGLDSAGLMRWRIELAMRAQRDTEELYKDTGIPSSEMEETVTEEIPLSENTIVAEDGTLESFSEVSGGSGTRGRRKGRKSKQ